MKLFSFIFAAALLALVAFFALISVGYPEKAREFPWLILFPVMVLAIKSGLLLKINRM